MKKGSKMTEEQRKKLSESHKGQISPNKGKKASRETKLKLSLSHKQLWKNPDYRKKMIQINIVDMQELAKAKGGKCLSEKYINAREKLKWQCEKGHIWEAAPSHVQDNHWCPYCAHRVRLTIEEMKGLAKSKGGECLSEQYINSKTKLIWQCKEGHQWMANPHNIKSGKWCPVCARKRTEPKLRLN